MWDPESAPRDLGTRTGMQRPEDATEGPGQREAPSEQLHTWLANATRGGGVPQALKGSDKSETSAIAMASNNHAAP